MFVVSGWAKGDSVPLPKAASGQNQRQFAVIGTFNYTDGSTSDPFVAQFNPDTDSSVNWQYSAQMMVATKDYSSVTVTLAYDYNANTACFDGIQLYKEEFGHSYTYDDKGNVTSVKDLQKKTTTYQYTNNNLTKEILPTNAAVTYTYDNYHNVKTATTTEGQVYSFEYDTYGNNTKVSIGSGSTKISSSAAYAGNGNYLSSTTDAQGKVTYYGYDPNTNVLEWVKYPEDTDATRTNYSYDDMYRLTSAQATTDTGTALTASYTYTNDNLTAIQTGSTNYSFTYGNFSLRTAAKAGNNTLASYVYTNDRNNYLKKLAYGNGDSVQYTYDSYGRVTLGYRGYVYNSASTQFCPAFFTENEPLDNLFMHRLSGYIGFLPFPCFQGTVEMQYVVQHQPVLITPFLTSSFSPKRVFLKKPLTNTSLAAIIKKLSGTAFYMGV